MALRDRTLLDSVFMNKTSLFFTAADLLNFVLLRLPLKARAMFIDENMARAKCAAFLTQNLLLLSYGDT